MSNGTVALHLALHALGVQSGDEVIALDLTFAATANAVLHAGASHALVDVDHTCILWWMDPGAVKRRGPAHQGDRPRSHRLATVEDAAEEHGAELH